MYLILAEGYKNANFGFLTIKSTGEIWVSMKDVGNGIGVKNILMNIKKHVNEYKMTERKIYKKFTNLSQEKLNTIIRRKPYVKNDVLTIVSKRCRGEKTRGIRTIHEFRKKLMIPDFESPRCAEFEAKLK